jgi:multiple sugar transport system substrate-binding protein
MTHTRRVPRAVVALACTASLAFAASACTGSSSGGATDDASKETTITFWHGWSQPNEVKGIQDNVAAFEKAHPNIHIKVVKNVTDDKINQALRAGGSSAPDVVSSFTTDNVGKFCSSGVWADLAPFLVKSGTDVAKTFPTAMAEYTQFNGKRCALPLLGDAYGLYYNKDAFKAAGIASPPKTMSEFLDDAKKLTKTKGDSYSRLGFMPVFHGYESTATHYLGQWGASYFDSSGKSALASDPKVAAMFQWQRQLVDALGGFAKLEKYRSSFGEEFSPKNPFETGQVAMAIDGEWRTANLKADGVAFDWATAPFPVPDDQAATYGRGYQTGTIIGIARTSSKQNAAWELVKYLTTDTDAVVGFANAIHNVPSTYEALKSPKIDQDPNFRTFLDIAGNPASSTTPASVNGGAYQTSLQNFGYSWEAGKVADLAAGLAGVDKEIDAAIAQAK